MGMGLITKSTENFSRNTHIDIARGIAILLVAVGHSNPPFSHFIYLFHVALFFFISGYLFKPQYTDHPKVYIGKRIKRLYVPFVAYGLLFLLIHNFLYDCYLYNEGVYYSGESVQRYSAYDHLAALFHLLIFNRTEQLLGGFWFLKSLFLATAAHFSIYYFVKSHFKIDPLLGTTLITLIIFFGAEIISKLNLNIPISLARIPVLLFLYNIGLIYKAYERKVPFNVYLFALSLLILSFSSSYVGSIDLVHIHYHNFFFLLVNSVSGIYFSLYLAKKMPPAASRFFILAGQNSVHILALHFLSFKIISAIYVYSFNLPLQTIAAFPVINSQGLWLFYSIAGICIPLLLSCSIKTLLSKDEQIHQKQAH